MSHSHDPLATSNPDSDSGYGGGGRTARPLFALIPIGIGLALALAMLVGGIHVMTTPSGTAAGEAHVLQTAIPASSAAGSS